ncbi:MAG: hypothetical protein ACFFC7_30165 [Candidatus Hermodarchaeota archaeon]
MENDKLIKMGIALTIIMLILLSLISIMVEEQVWTQTYGNYGFQRAFAVIQTPDGGFALAGYTESDSEEADFWLVKTDVNGIAQWNQTYGHGAKEECYDAILTIDGGFALVGITNSYGAGEQDFWLVKTDANGILQWNQSYGGPGRDTAGTVIQTIDGGFALAGYINDTSRYWWYNTFDFWLVKTDTNGTMLWNQTYGDIKSEECYNIIQTADGGFALTGCTESYGARGKDFWLVKTDANGVAQWNQTYGGTGEEVAYTVIQTADGGFALAGSTNSYGAGDRDFWLVKTDVNGVIQWNQTYGDAKYDWCTDAVQTADGGFALAGTGTMQQLLPLGDKYDAWIVKTDANGRTEWTQSFENPYWDTIYAVVQTTDEGFALAGETNLGFDFRLWKIDPRSSLSDTLEITTPALTATLLTVVMALLLLYWRTKE